MSTRARDTHCPYCYRPIDRARLAYQCTGFGAPGMPDCRPTVDAERQRFTGYALPSYPVFAAPGGLRASRKAPCPQCGGETGVRACPVCHTPLMAGFADSASPLIGIVGGKGAGKSIYLTVLSHELRHAVRRRFDADIRLAGDQQGGSGSPQAWLDDFERRLFTGHRLLDATAAADRGRVVPVVFEWRQHRRRFGRDRFPTTVLSFYDAAGEDQTSQERVHLQSYLGAAHGLIMVLDPWQLPGAADHVAVPDSVRLDAEPPLSVLGRITDMLRAARTVKGNDRIRTPLAVVFAKFDALFDHLGPTHPLRAAPPARAHYDETAGADTHEHVRTVLHDFGADDVDSFLRTNYRHYRYFAVSALGSAPDYATNEVDHAGVAPFRVDEPLLWLLSRLGVVERGRA